PVGPALRIEARAGIAVPVPRASDAAARLEHPHRDPELAQAMELVHAREAGADDDDVMGIHGRGSARSWRTTPAPTPASYCGAGAGDAKDATALKTRKPKERRYQRRVISNLMRRAHDLGYTLLKNEDLPTASFPSVIVTW